MPTQPENRLAVALRALDLPLAAASIVTALGGSALHNARQAMAALAGQVADRDALRPASGHEAGDLVELDRDECLELLRSKQVGRLAYIAREGVPDIAPVNYSVAGSDILLRSGPGPKLQAAERRELVAFEVDDLDEESASGWSVVLQGRASRLTAAQVRAIDEADLPRPWATGPRFIVFRIRPTRITGRRVC